MPLDMFSALYPSASDEWLDWQTKARAEYELFQTIRTLRSKDVEDCIRLILESDEPEDMARFLLEIAHDCEEWRRDYCNLMLELKRVRGQIRQAVDSAVQAIENEPPTDEDEA